MRLPPWGVRKTCASRRAIGVLPWLHFTETDTTSSLGATQVALTGGVELSSPALQWPHRRVLQCPGDHLGVSATRVLRCARAVAARVRGRFGARAEDSGHQLRAQPHAREP